MGRRKFSFGVDIPRLKIGALKVENRSFKEQLAFQPDSPPLTPKSVRPPLPNDIEFELRNACAIVLQGFKPSTQTYDEHHGGSSKPQLDYAAIRGAPRHQDVTSPPLTKSNTHNEHLAAERPTAQDAAPAHENLNPAMYRYKPNTAVEDLFRPEELDRFQKRRSRAATRADELMAGPPKVPEHKTVERTLSQHGRPKSTTQPAALLAAPKPEFAERPRAAGRTDSVETTGSTPHTDSTDYPWSASTAITSAADTPARGSKRTSTLPFGADGNKLDTSEVERMRAELEKHIHVQDDGAAAYEAASAIALPAERSDSKMTTPPTQVPTPVARVPARKPVPGSGRETSRPPTRQAPDVPESGPDTSRPPTRQAPDVPRSESVQHALHPDDAAVDTLSRSQSRKGRQARRTENDLIPARAASRARSITREVKDYMRSASRSRQAAQRPEGPQHRRSESRTRQIATNVKEYLRPGSSAGSRKPSMDISRDLTRTQSRDSMTSADAGADQSAEGGRNHWRQWKPYHHAKSSVSSVELNGNTSSPGRGRAGQRDGKSPSPSKPTGQRPINLNRELPPLPGLDSWKNEAPNAASTQASTQPSTVASPVSSQAPTITPTKQATDTGRNKYVVAHTKNKDAYARAIQGEINDIVASRMGAPVSTKRASPTPRGLNVSKPRQAPGTSIPAVPKHAPPAPPAAAHVQRGPGGLDLSSTSNFASFMDTDPSVASAKRAAAGRRRSKSTQEAYLPSMSEKLRKASAHAPDGKPIVASGRAQLVSTSRSSSYNKSGELARTLSTNNNNNNNRTYSPLSQLNAANKNTALGHSRSNSDHNRLAQKKSSMDEYGRIHHNRHQDMMDTASNRSGTSSGNYPSTPRSGSQAPAYPGAASKVKQPAKKWWRFGTGSQDSAKKQQHWMEDVVRSGASSGVLVSDEAAAAPFIRY